MSHAKSGGSDATSGMPNATSGMANATSGLTSATFKIWRSDGAEGGGFREYPVTLVPGMVVEKYEFVGKAFQTYWTDKGVKMQDL